MALSLKQLSIFEATARLGRLIAAAEEQSVSQSAASQALKELESSLGYRLFNRSGRELVITGLGQEILPRVRDILSNVESLNAPDSSGVSGAFRVAASVTIASYLCPGIMADFLARYPQVEPDLQINNTRQVIQCLEKQQAHVGLIEGPAAHHQLQIIPWREDSLQIFCHPHHPLAQQGMSIEQMAKQRWILREPGSGTRAIFDQALQQAGVKVNTVMALNRQEAIKQSVKAGLGVGCLSRLAIAEELRRGELVELQTPLILSRQLSVVVRPEARSGKLVQAFLQRLDI